MCSRNSPATLAAANLLGALHDAVGVSFMGTTVGTDEHIEMAHRVSTDDLGSNLSVRKQPLCHFEI